MNYLITGAAKGIGLELTLFALEAGHTVVALVRDPNNARYLSQAKTTFPKQLEILKADVTIMTDLQMAQQKIADQPIDVLINNAGIMEPDEEKLKDFDLDSFHKVFEVNSIAPVMVTRTFLANLKKGRNPKLVNISSKMGSIDDNSSGGYYSYRMSKAALNMFSKTVAVDHPGITTLSVHPGWVRTEMGGAQAPILPRESARGIFQLINSATPRNSGQFLDYKGKPIPW